MQIIKNITEIRAALKAKKIAFVPTMGALHDGHLALVKKASELAETVVVSIFVNKTQFNDLSDYQRYPRQIEQDIKLLKQSGATHVFLPEEKEIFPDDFAFKIIPTKFTDCLCATARPGHFDGVALIITKFFNIIKPDIAIFGQKDFQQILIIKKLVSDLNFEVEIFAHDVVREKSGLAMSSRNQRLSQTSKIKAAEIFKILNEIKNEVKISPNSVTEILQKKRENLLKSGFEKIDYLEIRDEKNLKLITNFDQKIPARIFIAVYLDAIRLIDNLAL
jgi:pantoate--beta-alanine ligase